MKVLPGFVFLFPLLLVSCAIVTTPVKIVGKAVTTTVDVTGTVVGSGVEAITPGSDDEDHENEESD